jgi:hypothetical protein
MLTLPPVVIETAHHFADGLYCRQATGPKDTICITRVHKRENFAFIMTGECSIISEHGVIRVKAPHMFKTLAGTKRMLQFHEDSTWFTVHALPPGMDESTGIEDIEDYFACNTLAEYEQLQIETDKNMEAIS